MGSHIVQQGLVLWGVIYGATQDMLPEIRLYLCKASGEVLSYFLPAAGWRAVVVVDAFPQLGALTWRVTTSTRSASG